METPLDLVCDEHWKMLGSTSQRSLALLGKRSRPIPSMDVALLERAGLAEFVRETASGTTWYRLTPRGRDVYLYAYKKGLLQL